MSARSCSQRPCPSMGPAKAGRNYIQGDASSTTQFAPGAGHWELVWLARSDRLATYQPMTGRTCALPLAPAPVINTLRGDGVGRAPGGARRMSLTIGTITVEKKNVKSVADGIPSVSTFGYVERSLSWVQRHNCTQFWPFASSFSRSARLSEVENTEDFN